MAATPAASASRMQKAASSPSASSAGVVGEDEIAAAARQGAESGRLQPRHEMVALGLQVGRQTRKIGVVLGEADGDRPLQIGRRGEGEVLVRLRDHAHQRRRARRYSRPSSRSG